MQMIKKATDAPTKITSVDLVAKMAAPISEATAPVTIVLSFIVYILLFFCCSKSYEKRQRKEKSTALSFPPLNAKASAVGEDNFARDAEAQARSVVATLGNAEEFVETPPT